MFEKQNRFLKPTKLKPNLLKSTPQQPPRTCARVLSKVLERPSSQMSYLEHFLKETSGSPASNNIYNNVPVRGPKMGISVKLKNDSDHLEQYPATSPTSSNQRPGMHSSPSSVSQHLHQQPIYHNQPTISSPRSNYSLDDRDGVNRNLSFNSSKSNLSDASYEHGRSRMHQFVVRSFTSPTKCMHCTSLMVSVTVPSFSSEKLFSSFYRSA